MAFFGAVYNGGNGSQIIAGTLTVNKIRLATGGALGDVAVGVTGDDDTGLVFSAANTVQLHAGNEAKVQISSFTTQTLGSGFNVGAGLQLPGDTAPGALGAGTNDDVNIGTISNFSRYRLTPNAGGSTITSIQGGADGSTIILHNTSLTVDITLAHAAGTGTAANRIYCPGSVNVTLARGGTRILCYDTADSRWRVI